jgi:hypothetical protein
MKLNEANDERYNRIMASDPAERTDAEEAFVEEYGGLLMAELEEDEPAEDYWFGQLNKIVEEFDADDSDSATDDFCTAVRYLRDDWRSERSGEYRLEEKVDEDVMILRHTAVRYLRDDWRMG